MEVLRKNLAPDASDAGFRDIVEFFGLRRGHLALDEYLSRFERARRRAEARLPNNGFFPDVMLPSLCLQNSGVTPNQKSMILSSAGGDPSLNVMKRHMRRISQPCGMALKQDALESQVSPFGTCRGRRFGRQTGHWGCEYGIQKGKGETKKRGNWALPGPGGEWEHSQSS